MKYEDFKAEIFALTDINLGLYKERQMKRRIDSLIKKNNFKGYTDYVKAIKSDQILFNEFINHITINVSEFYRNPRQWEVFEQEILPGLLSRMSNLKIWSCACSTGDEPYTLVMILNKFLPLNKIKIMASDIDRNALEKARAGIYNSKSVEKLPSIYLSRYFDKSGDKYIIKDEIKQCVDFKRHNLLKDNFPVGCDLIVCRNVLIYFTEEAKTEIYTKFNKALNVGGVLFVGSTEQIILPGRYNLTPVRTFFYVKDNNL